MCRLIFIRQRPTGSRSSDDKLMPALDTIEGLGDKAAEAVVDAAAKGQIPFQG